MLKLLAIAVIIHLILAIFKNDAAAFLIDLVIFVAVCLLDLAKS